MKKTLIALSIGAGMALAAATASAGVVATFGAGSAVKTVTNSANFDGNLALANNYIEDGLLLSYFGSGNNNGCGYAGFDCVDSPDELSPAFSGNFMATGGNNAYVSVRMADGSDFTRVEFAAGSLYLNLNGYWRTFNNGLQTGFGGFSRPAGAILGLTDLAGFDEVRYFAFAQPNATAGFSAAAFDDVRVGVPEPGSLLLFGAGLVGLAGLRRKTR